MSAWSFLSLPAKQGRGRWLWLGVPAALLAAVVLSGCGGPQAPARKPRAAEVFVTHPIHDEVTDYQDFTGRLSAVKTVELRARVSGYVTKATFKEGDVVHEGDVLFEIDPRPYKAVLEANQAQVTAAKAQTAVDEAQVKLARVTYERARASGSAASPLEIDQDVAQLRVTEANLHLSRAKQSSAEANLVTAKLNYEWTKVRSPVTGRVSRRNVDPGNLVTQDVTVLTSIVTENPLYGYFDVDERTYLNLVGSGTTALSSWLFGLRFPVLMQLANETGENFSHVGTVDFIDNQVVATTGTVRMRGVFENHTGTLKPGLFVRVRVPMGHPYKALLIADEALLSDQGRKYVYVVNAKNVVVYRPVTIGQAVKGLRVIKEGLTEGDRVIVTGMQRVRRGEKVTPKFQAPPRPPHSPLTRLLVSLGGKGGPADKEAPKQGG